MMHHDIMLLLYIVQGREYVRSPPHSDTSSSGSRGGESVSLASLGITMGDRVVIGAATSRQPKVSKESSENERRSLLKYSSYLVFVYLEEYN